MQTLLELLQSRDPENQQKFMADIIAYVDEIKKTFRHPEQVDEETLVRTISELIPTNDAYNVFQKLEVLNFTRDENDLYYKEINLLYEAANLKENILENVSAGSQTALNVNDQLSVLLQQPITPETQPEIKQLSEIKRVVNILKSLNHKGRIERLFASSAMLNSIISQAPSQIVDHPLQNSSIREDLEKLNDDNKEMLEISGTKIIPEAELEIILKNAERQTEKLIAALSSTLTMMLRSVAQMVPAQVMKTLAQEYEKLLEVSQALLDTESDISNLQAKIDQYTLLFTGLVKYINDVTNASVTKESLEEEASFLQQSKTKFPVEQYPYLFTASNLLSAENSFLQEQTQPGKEFQNSNKFYFNSMAGELAPLISGVIEESTKGDENSSSLTTPGVINQKTYRILSSEFYDAETHEIQINVPKDRDQPVWHLKCNLKITSHTTDEGLSVLHLGTDSSIVCNAVIGNSVLASLKNLLTTILDFQKNLTKKHVRFVTKEKHKTKKKTFVEDVVTLISSFKQGEISFDQFCEKIHGHAVKAGGMSHDGLIGKGRQMLTGKLPGTAEAIIQFDADLTKISKDLQDPIIRLLRPEALVKVKESAPFNPHPF